MHGGGSAPSCCAFTHRVAFEEGSGGLGQGALQATAAMRTSEQRKEVRAVGRGPSEREAQSLRGRLAPQSFPPSKAHTHTQEVCEGLAPVGTPNLVTPSPTEITHKTLRPTPEPPLHDSH